LVIYQEMSLGAALSGDMTFLSDVIG
jgi:hypothetical protein